MTFARWLQVLQTLSLGLLKGFLRVFEWSDGQVITVNDNEFSSGTDRPFLDR